MDDHASSCDQAIDLGVVAANGRGNGNSGALHLSAEALRDAFGSGRTAVHVELGKQPGGGCLTANGIMLLVPGTFPAPEGAQR